MIGITMIRAARLAMAIQEPLGVRSRARCGACRRNGCACGPARIVVGDRASEPNDGRRPRSDVADLRRRPADADLHARELALSINLVRALGNGYEPDATLAHMSAER
jgi:hypothetical protein